MGRSHVATPLEGAPALRPTPTCNELITSVALLDNIAWVLLTLGENETNLLLGLPENELTIVEKSLQTSGSAHIA
jgi:hypothetical protein